MELAAISEFTGISVSRYFSATLVIHRMAREGSLICSSFCNRAISKAEMEEKNKSAPLSKTAFCCGGENWSWSIASHKMAQVSRRYILGIDGLTKLRRPGVLIQWQGGIRQDGAFKFRKHPSATQFGSRFRMANQIRNRSAVAANNDCILS